MLSLVTPEQANIKNAEKEAVINKLIAAGLNSLVGHLNSNTNTSEERRLLELFMTQSFEKIMPCWPMLDDRIKFHVFKTNLVEFEKFMLEKSKVTNV